MKHALVDVTRGDLSGRPGLCSDAFTVELALAWSRGVQGIMTAFIA